jgi:hypothetical protein
VVSFVIFVVFCLQVTFPLNHFSLTLDEWMKLINHLQNCLEKDVFEFISG